MRGPRRHGGGSDGIVAPAADPHLPASEPSGQAPSGGAIVRRALLIGAAAAVVFGVVLPRVVDYDAVRAALAALTPWQFLLLAGVTALAYIANAGPARVLVPGLSWPQAVGSDLAARAVASTVPGPSDVATRFTLYRQWSVPDSAANAGILLMGLCEHLAGFALPAIAAAGVLLGGQGLDSSSILLAAFGLAVVAGAAAVLVALARSEPFARKAGSALERVATRGARLARRPAPTGIAAGVLELRGSLAGLLTGRGLRGLAAGIVGALAWFVVLEVALVCVGVGPDLLPPTAVLTTIGVVGIISLVPVTPGAVGVAELTYLGMLSAVAGPGSVDQLTAAVTLLRVAQWLAPILIGWIVLLLIRRGHRGALIERPGTAPVASAP